MLDCRLVQNLYFAGPTNDINCDYLCITFILLITTLKSKHLPNY
jgi:hypothetical protein